MLLFQRWEVSARRPQRVIGGVWAPSCLSSWLGWWVKKYLKKMLSLLWLRCYELSVGVLAFNSLTVFMVLPGCVWFCALVCMCLSRWSCFGFFCLCMCVSMCVRCVLAPVSYSGSRGVPGVSVWLSPPAWAPSAGPGVSSLWASMLAPGAVLGSEHTDLRSAWKVKTRAALKVLELVQDQRLLSRQAWEERGISVPFVCKTADRYSAVLHVHIHMLIRTCCSLEGHLCTHRHQCRCRLSFQFFIVYSIWINSNWLPVGTFSYQPSVVLLKHELGCYYYVEHYTPTYLGKKTWVTQMSPLMIMSGYGPGKDTHTQAHSVSWSLQDKILPGAVLTVARNPARTPAACIRREGERQPT